MTGCHENVGQKLEQNWVQTVDPAQNDGLSQNFGQKLEKQNF